MNSLRTLWWKIYPNQDRHRWMAVLWLPFMIWFFLDPLWKHAGPLLWIGNTIYGLVFIWLYLYSFSRREPLRLICGRRHVVMTAALVPFNNGACQLPDGLCGCGGRLHSQSVRALSLIGIDLVLLGLYAYHLQLPLGFWGSMLMLIVLVGVGNHFGAIDALRRRRNSAVPTMKSSTWPRWPSASASRAICTICLGHTLSLITLKAELARKLVDRDPERAKQEMLDVEHTSRAALADVREAISGYRGEGLAAELVRARKTLETAGITVNSDVTELPLDSGPGNSAGAGVARSRHQRSAACAGAAMQRSTCNATTISACLEIADNGSGADAPEGNGLRGMRERLEAIGGSLQRQSEAGTRLVIHLPLAPAAATLRN